MKNKLFKLTALCMIVGLVACQKDVDVIGITDNLANKTMQGYYTYTAVDSAAMTTFKKELFLGEDAKGQHIGYYRECTAGNVATSDVKKTLTWEAIMAVDHLSMKVVATLEDGNKMDFVWADGVIRDAEVEFPKSVANSSNVDVQLGLYADLANTRFEHKATAYFKHLVPTPYLKWTAKVDRSAYLPADTLAKKNQYLSEIEPFMDTIIWYMREIVKEHTIGRAYLDTVYEGSDTSFVVVNAVYVDPTPNKDGKHLITHLVSSVASRDLQSNDRPKTTITSVMEFNRADGANTALYTFEKHEWSEKFYTAPTDAQAIVQDSIYTFTASSWFIPTFTNAAKFDVRMLGDYTLTEIKTEGGVETMNKQETVPDAVQTLSISEFSKKKGEATQAELKYKLK